MQNYTYEASVMKSGEQFAPDLRMLRKKILVLDTKAPTWLKLGNGLVIIGFTAMLTYD